MISCRARLVTMGETWLYQYDPETKQQSMEWRHSGSTRPKKFRVQKSAGNFSPRFFGIKTASFSLSIFQMLNYQRGVLLISAGVYGGHFEGKTPTAGRSPRGLLLARQCPGSPGICNPKETDLPVLPVSSSSILFSGSGPVGVPPVPWKVVTFRPTRRSLLPRRPGLTTTF